MTSKEIRQSFLDFFAAKQHTVVPSASLLPQSPGLLFNNAGMNQFVPYFLGTEAAPYDPARAADTQKCIRAGGKHNDLDDVGYDTYHHTFFEMLGNWSFGDYFKKEMIAWAWELIVEHWGFPANRLYASVYMPDKEKGDPAEFDQEAYDLWANLFAKAGLDPKVHIVYGDKKDNFWMMGETGPCGPCSELHVDLTPNGDSQGKLVNQDSDLCIEIWNLVFIQLNAEEDGTFRNLPHKHIDTGMGFERACNIIQGTKHFTDFSQKPTNYATDVFTPIFKKLEELTGKTYQDIYPTSVSVDKSSLSDEMKTAIAFRVVADHLRTLSFSIADGILPGNTGRNYVLRRITRRAINYGRTLGFLGEEAFLPKLVGTLVDQFGGTFPELVLRRQSIIDTLEKEENAFNQTLERGIQLFGQVAANNPDSFPADEAFKLYDTYGFPTDLTQLLCEERRLKLDLDAIETLMEEARELSRGAQKGSVVRALDISTTYFTEFIGYEEDACQSLLLEAHEDDQTIYLITDRSPFYVEMGGQLGDTGTLSINGTELPVASAIKVGKAIAHCINRSELGEADAATFTPGITVQLSIDSARRRHIEQHHTATHLLHWALHEVVSKDATQQGSLVTPDRMRFDFTSSALKPKQIQNIQEKVQAAIQKGGVVSTSEVQHADIADREDILQFFGDKYGDTVRVVQIGGDPHKLNGYSMELCGGTHSTSTEHLGTFLIKSESAISAGVRRIEAVCGESAIAYIKEQFGLAQGELTEAQAKLDAANAKLTKLQQAPEITPAAELPNEPSAANLAELQAHVAAVRDAAVKADKKVNKAQAAAAASIADEVLTEYLEQGGNIVLSIEGSANLLQELLNGCKKKQFANAAFFIVDDGNRLHLGAICGADTDLQAGKLIQQLAPLAGGKGGGKPDMARGAAPERDKCELLISTAQGLLG